MCASLSTCGPRGLALSLGVEGKEARYLLGVGQLTHNRALSGRIRAAGARVLLGLFHRLDPGSQVREERLLDPRMYGDDVRLQEHKARRSAIDTRRLSALASHLP